METNRKMILALAAVALMVAVAFVGFMSIEDNGADADDPIVAKIGDVGYTTLESAITAATTGETILIVDDIETTDSVKIQKSVDINLNGHKISRTGGTVFEINGTGLKVDLKYGTINTKGNGIFVVGESSKIELIVKGVTINANTSSSDCIACKGTECTITVENCKLNDAFTGERSKPWTGASGVCSYNTGNSIIVKDTEINAYWFGVYHNGSTRPVSIDILNSTIICNTMAVYVSNSNGDVLNTLNINGSEIVSNKATAVEVKFANVNITDSTLTSKSEFNHGYNSNGATTNGCAIATTNNDTSASPNGKTKGTISIDNPTLTGIVYRWEIDTTSVDDKATIEIVGGSFTDLANAVKYAKSGATIRLIDDVVLTGAINIEGKELYLDLNGHTITSTETKTGKLQAFKLTGGASLTIDGTKNGSSIVGNIYVGVAKDSENNTLIINGGTYIQNLTEGDEAVIQSNGATVGKSIITINDAVIKCKSPEGVALYFAGPGTYVLNNCTVEGAGGVEVRAGTLKIENCQITATGEVKIDPNGNGPTSTGSAIVASPHNTDAGEKINVTINGGTFKGDCSLVTKNTTSRASSVVVIIYDGMFEGDIAQYYGGLSIVSGANIRLPENKFIGIAEGMTFRMGENAVFTGVIFSLTDMSKTNGLKANGMKAGVDGISITAGSLKINGHIIQDSGTYSGATVTVSGDSIKIEGTLDAGATMEILKGTIVTIENDKSFTSNGEIVNNGKIVNEGTVTNTGVLKMNGESAVTGPIVNNGIIDDERAAGSAAVVMDTDKSSGVVVTKDNADAYKDQDVKVIVEDPESSGITKGTVTVNSDTYAFIDSVITTGDLVVTMNDRYKTYSLTIPKGTVIPAGTIVSVEYLSFTSDTTAYEITTPGITKFSVKVPVQTGFKSAKVYCDGSQEGVSNVKYNSSQGYVTFDAGHNSTFTIVLSNAAPSPSTLSSDAFDKNTAFIGAIVVLVVAILALAVVIKRN